MYTNSLDVTKIKGEINPDLEIHYGIVEYLANYNSQEAWQVRGISGRGGSSQKYFKYRQKKIEDLKQQLADDQQLQTKLDNFVEEALTLFHAILDEKKEIVKQYIDKEFYFVLGAARTGGTFMLKELSRAVEWPYEEVYMSMLHEALPDFDIEEPYTMGWRKPQNYYHILFQLVQFLVYLQREFPEQQQVVKKTRFSKCMQLIDHVFGERANYIVTVRHPGAINASRIETGATGDVADNLEKEANRTLYLWQNVYKEIVRDGVPAGQIEPVLFGPHMDQFLADFFTDHGSDKEPEQCKITQRDYDQQFWQSDYVVNSMDWVRMLWQIHDLEFPMPKKIL
ncbi:MAG: hypothetical protein ACQEP9_10235 [Bacillota bacterium]